MAFALFHRIPFSSAATTTPFTIFSKAFVQRASTSNPATAAHSSFTSRAPSSVSSSSSSARTFANTTNISRHSIQSGATSTMSSTKYDETPYVTAFVTVPNEEVADKITQVVVSTKLAACVNTIPGVKSSYWWKGKVETDTEMILMMKTRRSLVEKLDAKVKELHPYDVHEFIVNPIIAGNPDYLSWIGESTIKL